MKYLNIYQSVSKTTCSALLCAGVLSASFSVQAADEILYPSQKPLSLTEGVPPTVLVTLDDSGSMAADYAPDANSNGTFQSMRSNAYNSMYYDPSVDYVVPKEYVYQGGVIVGKDSFSTTFTNAKSNGYSSSNSGTNLTDYFYYYKYNVSSSCKASPVNKNSGCYTIVYLPNSHKQNFANWYSFYRTRQLATRSAAIRAFATMPDNVRLTWGALNSCYIGKNTGGSCSNNKLDRFAETHRANFFKWLKVLPADDATPLHAAMHRAAQVIKDDTDDAVCRANYHVLMTDGMWNGRSSNDTASPGNADSTAIARLPDGVNSYTSRAPYKDNQTNSLADVAFRYWATDLRTNLDNKISPYMPIKSADPDKDYWDPRNNPATWQHMVNFTVGLGLSNALTSSTSPTWNGDATSPTYNDIDELLAMGAGGKNWPTVANNSDNNVYDLWHAAINSRGEFFSADSPDTLISAFEKILERISGRSTTGSSPAINSGVGDDGTGYAFQASYAADKNWAGDLKATKKTLDEFGNFTSAQIWSAQELLDGRSTSRTIKMVKGTGLTDFTWSNLTTAQKTALNRDPDVNNNADTLGSARIDFLRGDRTKEGSTFRKRSSVLGDIVGSKPVTVRGARYLTGHANRIEGTDKKYEDFVTAQQSRKPMVYVGANDGMLHGFNANTGVEEFAFVPTAVFQHLNALTGTGYGEATHRFFVDGSPVVADVFIGGKWRTVLVGTLAAGGKSMFALDVTDPENITLLWEFNEDKLAASGYQAKLGYTFSQPTIARLHNGKWAAVVGNGYAAAGSESGKAALLIIDMEKGTLTKDLVVQGATGVANGMSTPKLADINGDGIADYAYSGDLQGNVWRFDLAPDNSDTSNPFLRKVAPRSGEASFAGFQVSFGGSALFSAIDGSSNRQPITAAPSVVRHPTGKGYIIVVGTGRFYADGDKNGLTDSTQSIYGVWDSTTKVARSVNKTGLPFSSTSVTRGQLHAQTMQAGKEAVVNGKDARLLSDTQVPWAEQAATGVWSTSKDGVGLKAGWYFDLVLNKEMIVSDMLQFGQTLYFQSLVPNTNPCASGVENWSYAINPATGGRTSHHAWNDFRSVADPAKVITAIRMDGEGGLSIGQRPDKKFELCTGATCNEITPDPASIGRQSWRVVEGQ